MKSLFFSIIILLISLAAYSQEKKGITLQTDSIIQKDSFSGKPFPEIVVFNLQKKLINIKLNPDTVYLIDYWASWCRPCIGKLPEYKAFYQKYKKDAFQILSIALDNDYEAWRQSVKENKISWRNYATLNGFHTQTVKTFHITGIPFTVLAGKGNKIIKLDPSEAEIETYLSHHLDPKRKPAQE